MKPATLILIILTVVVVAVIIILSISLTNTSSIEPSDYSQWVFEAGICNSNVQKGSRTYTGTDPSYVPTEEELTTTQYCAPPQFTAWSIGDCDATNTRSRVRTLVSEGVGEGMQHTEDDLVDVQSCLFAPEYSEWVFEAGICNSNVQKGSRAYTGTDPNYVPTEEELTTTQYCAPPQFTDWVLKTSHGYYDSESRELVTDGIGEGMSQEELQLSTHREISSFFDQSGTGEEDVACILYEEKDFKGNYIKVYVHELLSSSGKVVPDAIRYSTKNFDDDIYKYKSIILNPGLQLEYRSSNYFLTLDADANIPDLQTLILSQPQAVLLVPGMAYGSLFQYSTTGGWTRWSHWNLTYALTITYRDGYVLYDYISSNLPVVRKNGMAMPVQDGYEIVFGKETVDGPWVTYWDNIVISRRTVTIHFKGSNSSSSSITAEDLGSSEPEDTVVIDFKELLDTLTVDTTNKNTIRYPGWNHWGQLYRATVYFNT